MNGTPNGTEVNGHVRTCYETCFLFGRWIRKHTENVLSKWGGVEV